MKEHTLHIDRPFVFESGESLPSLDLVYHTSDRVYRKGEPVLWICHALTGNSDPEDWWPGMVGPGKLLDTGRYYIVCAGMLCSPYGPSSPASVNPASGRPYLLDFPKTTVRDMVRAEIMVREYLGIEHIDLMIGPSIGGFQSLEWAVMEPDRIGTVVFLATATRVTPFMTAFNESQRMALLADPSFLQAGDLSGGRKGLACARSIALLSYRTFEGYNLTQEEKDPDTLFAGRACSYQRYQGKKLVDRFDAYCYWYLTMALDSQNIGRGRGGVEKALERIRAKSHVISIDSDMLFPPAHGKATAAAIRGAEYHELSSLFGHDGFLVENDALRSIMEPIVLDALQG